jgi:multiple sugar transport system permease protein
MNLILPVTGIGILLRGVDLFKTVDLVYIPTQGGPGNSSETLTFFTYVQGFKFFNPSYASAMSFIQLILVIIAAKIFLSFIRAYAIARFQVGREHLAFWILSIRMFPPIATILPLFVIFRFVGLVDSYSGLVLSYTVFNLPFAIWILKGFIEDLPREIEEAAKVDGARPLQIFHMIVIPLAAPGIVVAALFTFIFAWNDFAYAVIFSGSKVTPLPVVIAQFAGGHEILWGQISAAAIIAIAPALFVATFLQKYLTRGLTMGAIK